MKFKLPGHDRRRFSRVILRAEVFYRVLKVPEGETLQTEKESMAYLFNVSEIGLGFLSGSPMPVGVEMEAVFNFLIDGVRDLKITAEGQVRYCLLTADYKRHQVGIEFTKLQEKDRKFIADYVRAAPGDKKRP